MGPILRAPPITASARNRGRRKPLPACKLRRASLRNSNLSTSTPSSDFPLSRRDNLANRKSGCNRNEYRKSNSGCRNTGVLRNRQSIRSWSRTSRRSRMSRYRGAIPPHRSHSIAFK
jgi:hypothetical protein